MAHSCPTCDQACYCDGEDTWWDEVEDCNHQCEEAEEREEEE